MASWLKQSTAVEIAFGPFVDDVDGVTAETGLTITKAEVRLKKNGADWGQKNEATSAVHEENGWYRVLLDATDTDTLGLVVVAVAESGALPVWREFLVIAANVYDSIVGGGDALDVSLIQWLGTAPNVLVASRVDASVGAVAAAAITAASIATGAIDADAIAADAVAEIQSGLATDATVVAGVAALQADTDNIQTRIPAALVGGRMDSSVGALAANAVTAAALAADAVAEIADGVWDEAVAGHSTSGTYGEHHYLIYSGQVSGAATSTTLIDSALTQADTDHWKGRIILFLDGALRYQATDVTGFDPALDKLTFSAVTQAPTSGPGGTRYIIL